MTTRIYTAESVTSGHPDKLADLIADSILDECLEQDENSRVACEVMLAHNKCFISGEITTEAKVDYEYIAKTVIAQIGYDPEEIEYEVRIHEQSGDIRSRRQGRTRCRRPGHCIWLCMQGNGQFNAASYRTCSQIDE